MMAISHRNTITMPSTHPNISKMPSSGQNKSTKSSFLQSRNPKSTSFRSNRRVPSSHRSKSKKSEHSQQMNSELLSSLSQHPIEGCEDVQQRAAQAKFGVSGTGCKRKPIRTHECPPDHLLRNALRVIRQPAKLPEARIVDDSRGHTQSWYKSGWARNFVLKPGYGRVPDYILERKKELALYCTCSCDCGLQPRDGECSQPNFCDKGSIYRRERYGCRKPYDGREQRYEPKPPPSENEPLIPGYNWNHFQKHDAAAQAFEGRSCDYSVNALDRNACVPRKPVEPHYCVPPNPTSYGSKYLSAGCRNERVLVGGIVETDRCGVWLV